MSDTLRKEVNRTVKEYGEALDSYNKLLDKYFPLQDNIPSVVLTDAFLKEFKEAEAKVTAAKCRWEDAVRKLQLGHQTP